MQQTNGVYEFGPFRLQPREKILLRGPETVPIPPKTFDLLLVLIENQGRVLDKESLMKMVWPDTFVEEGNLSRNIFHLRKTLGEGYIETLPKRGYRFVKEVSPAAGSTPIDEHPLSPVNTEEISERPYLKIMWVFGALAVIAPSLWYGFSRQAAPAPESLAVLPLRALDAEAKDDHLELGIADTIIGKLSQIRGLTVRPVSAVRQFSGPKFDALEAGRQLRVDTVLDGTIQRSGERLRARFNLISIRDGTSLWSETFDIPFSDVFSVQDQVAQQVASRMRPSLTSAERDRLTKNSTVNPAAYEAYVAGSIAFDGRTLTKMGPAIPLFEKAIELDPNYALAHARLAYAYAWMALFIEPANPSWLLLARAALQRAEKLDPNLPETHIVRYQLYWSVHGGFRIDEAIREVQKAHALRPVFDAELGILLAHLGLEEPAIRAMRRAVEADPLSSYKKLELVGAHETIGMFEEALQIGTRFNLTPYDTHSLIALGRVAEADAQIRRGFNESPQAPRVRAFRALLSALRGRNSEALQEIPQIRQGWRDRGYHHAAETIACVYAVQGNAREAVRWLRTATETGMPNYTLFQREPHLARIRSSVEYTRFMTELKPRWEAMEREFR